MLIVLGVGANQGDVRAAFAAARRELSRRVEVLAASSLWRTEALGPQQPEFLNAALLLDIPTHPRHLLALCHELEAAAGRDREGERRWGPRPLDLDLLVAGSCVVAGRGLCVPHPRFHQRRFALAPAAELVPDWTHQRCRRTLADLAGDPRVADQRCQVAGPYPGT